MEGWARVLWDPLNAAQRQNVYAWLDQINRHEVSPNNWCFFRILTNMTFERLGLPVNRERLHQDQAVIEHCYIGNGWYFDGHDGQLDYYIPFAMHFYSLVWSALAPRGHEDLCRTYQKRSAEFAPQFAQWFADDGAELAFGRSLTYRFAHSAFFAALALAGVESLPWGAVRHLLLQNLRHWMNLPTTGPDGILTIGYQYPNLIMIECYNAHGSPYWSFKAFLFLALPVDAYIAGGTELPDKRYPTGERLQSEKGVCAIQPWGSVGIYSTVPCVAGMIRPFPNTNLMANWVEIPTITARLEPGTHLLIHSVFGDLSHDPKSRLAAAPQVETAEGTVTVHSTDSRQITIHTEI